MSASARLCLTDLRAVFQLAGECRELGDDPRAWRSHLLAGLARLTGAGLGMCGEAWLDGPPPDVDLGVADWGWDNGFDRAKWLALLPEFNLNPLRSPLVSGFAARLPRADGACLARSDMIPDQDWYESDYYQSQRVLGADATLVSFRSAPGTVGEYAHLFLCRVVGERDFSARQKATVREAHALIGPLVGGPLARFAEPSPADLPPRVRRVLRCLLEGDSDKQVAARLGVSRYTVNQYVKVIFRHFRTTSRAELLARWVRRGWANGFAWDEPEDD